MTLKVINISKRYGDKWVLREVSFEADAGTIFGVLGTNGTGKSTLLRLLAGTEKPNTGNIIMDGNDVTTSLADISQLVAETHQSQKEFFWNRCAEIKSGGESQKGAFEKTIESKAKLLLLDDPLSSIDLNQANYLLGKLRNKTKEHGSIAIFATNDFELAFTFCDKIGVLHRGEFAQIGTPRELYEEPNSVAVASALGRNNFISAKRITFNNQPTQEFQTLTGEHRLSTGKTEKSRLGAINAAVTLSIRPEHISISTGASFPEDNLLKARIIGVEYLGATTLIKLDANGLMLMALVLRLVGINIGDECMVGLPPDRIKVLKE